MRFFVSTESEFLKIYQQLLIISEDFERIPKITEDFRRLPKIVKDFLTPSEVVGNLQRSSEVFQNLRQSSEAVDKSSEIQILWRRKISRILLNKSWQVILLQAKTCH